MITEKFDSLDDLWHSIVGWAEKHSNADFHPADSIEAGHFAWIGHYTDSGVEHAKCWQIKINELNVKSEILKLAMKSNDGRREMLKALYLAGNPKPTARELLAIVNAT